MRAIIFILIIVVVLVIIAGIATGFLDINQIRGAKAPASRDDRQRRRRQGRADARRSMSRPAR